MRALRSALTWLFRHILSIYFRDIEVLGEPPAEATRGSIFVANHVNAIIDPILILTTAPCAISPVAKSTLWKVPGLRWLLGVVDSVQIVRRRDDPGKQGGSNDQVFDHVASWLGGGGNILIFPEGSSHNEPHLIELKSGAARMLLRACEEGPPASLSFQSVALEFDAREDFRSRVLLIYGPVRSAADFPERGADFIATVTATIKADLAEMLVEAPTWSERRLIARLTELRANDAGDPTLAGANAIGREIEAAREAFTGETAAAAAARAAIAAYYDCLDALGLSDAEIAALPAPTEGDPASPRPAATGARAGATEGDPTRPRPAATGARAGATGLTRKLFLLSSLPLAAAGIVAYAVPYRLTRLIANRVTSADETSTIKLGAALVLYPLWATALIVASSLLAPWPTNLVLAVIALLSPFAAIPWLDALPAVRRSLRAFRHGRARLEEARVLRREALLLIREAQAGAAIRERPLPAATARA